MKAVDPRSALAKAQGILSKFNINIEVKSASKDVVMESLEELKTIDRAAADQLVDLFNQLDGFNALVRKQNRKSNVADRHVVIRKNFKSIVEDADRMVKQVSDDGKVGTVAAVRNWMIVKLRGTPQERLEKLERTAEQVYADVGDQIKTEKAIVDAYAEFRNALISGVGIAEVLKIKAEQNKNKAALLLEEIQNKMDAAEENGADRMEVIAIELERNQARQSFDAHERLYNIALGISHQLTTTEGVSEASFTSMAQALKIKTQAHQQSAAYFQTHKNVTTNLIVQMTQLCGLHEHTESSLAMKEGSEAALRKIGAHGTSIMKRAVEASYASIDPQAVKVLIDGAVKWEREYREIDEKARRESIKQNEEMERILTQGQKDLALARSESNKIILSGIQKEENQVAPIAKGRLAMARNIDSEESSPKQKSKARSTVKN